MKVIGDFNKLSPEMLKQLPTLKKGETKTFQLVTGNKNTDPDPDQRTKHPMHYATWQIPTRDRIQDWHTGEFIDIGVPDVTSKKDNISVKVFMPGKGEPYYRYSGKFSLSGDKGEEVELYQYLCMTNYNLSNEHRDKSVDAIFCEISVAKESKEMLSKSDALLEAMNAAKDMKEPQMREFAASLLWPDIADEGVLRSKVRKFAEEHPADFNKVFKDPSTKTKSEIKQAVDMDILSYDPTNTTISMGQTVLATLDVRHDSNFVEAFYEFTQSAANGKEVMANIRRQIKAKSKEVETAS